MVDHLSFACPCGALIGKDYHTTERIAIGVSNYYRWTCSICGQQFVEKWKDLIDLTPYPKQYGQNEQGFAPNGLPTLEKVLKDMQETVKTPPKEPPKPTNGTRKSKK